MQLVSFAFESIDSAFIKRLTLLYSDIGCVVTSLVIGCHARALWPNGAAYAYSYYGTLIGTPTPGIQWYKFRPPGVTPNRGMGPS